MTRPQHPIKINIIWPDPDPMPPACAVCRAPITVSPNGRPRRFCSNACRQKRYRYRQRQNDRDFYMDRQARAARSRLRRAERYRGRADETPLYPAHTGMTATQRDLTLLKLREGAPLENCQWCGRPMTRPAYLGRLHRTCSKACQKKWRDFMRHLDDAIWRNAIGLNPFVDLEMRWFNLYSREPQDILRHLVRVCDHCRKPYPVKGITSRFCSKRCRQAAWRRTRRLCKYCGRRFKFHIGGKKQLYCSRACKSRSRRVPTPADRVCEVCHKVFTPNKIHARSQRFCSRSCHSRYWSPRQQYQRVPAIHAMRPCVECGEPFEVNQYNHTKRLYCSRRCQWRAHVNRRHVVKQEPSNKNPALVESG